MKGAWKYLERAGDSADNTRDFFLSARDSKAARFFPKLLQQNHTQAARLITGAKNAAAPKVVETLQAAEALNETTELRQKKSLNNIRSASSAAKTTRVGRHGIQVVQHSGREH